MVTATVTAPFELNSQTVPKGRASGLKAVGGGRRENLFFFNFSRFLLNRPPPLGRFDTHPT